MDCEATEALREAQNDASPTRVELSPHWLVTCEQTQIESSRKLAWMFHALRKLSVKWRHVSEVAAEHM